MFLHAEPGRSIRAFRRLAPVAFAIALAWTTPAAAADAMLYRIFLRDGSTVVSYGDFTRVADRVVFSIPLSGLDTATPSLQLVSISESTVDWERTDSYAEAMRARQYAATRGEADFDALSNEVARALNDVATTKDPARRLALANEASRMLAQWPAKHHGYRASDVAQLSGLLDQAVSELRLAAGQSAFSLNLVATAAPPPDVPAMPAPTLRESIEQAFAIARLSPDVPDRISLLENVVAELDEPGVEGAWVSTLRSKAESELAAETRTDRRYRDLVNRMIAVADARAKEADVTAIESLVRAVLREDDRLGRKRPETTAALLATLDGRLDSARRLRLARDAWILRQRGLQEYQRRTQRSIDRFRRSIAGLEQIKALAGPAPQTLPLLAQRVSDAWRELKTLKPPPEAEAVHGLLIGALQMAIRAASARRLALVSGTDMNTAWEASSAAAGALMMFERAQEELKKLSTPPSL